MKNKSTRHKEENTFKFIPFSERIANVDIDVFHRVAHEYETEGEDECYFYQYVQKWNVLNLTEGYDEFKKEVKAYTIVTLPQLIHNKHFVVQTLLKHLQTRNKLYLQPLLELLIAVARDLRKEFYEYYEEVLDVLLCLLNTNDAEQLEWAFTSLAYMFKFLWRSLVKNIDSVFVTLLPLLSDEKPDYIIEFAAESFAFVARKVKDRKTFIRLIVKAVKKNDDGVAGCGKLLFEIIRGVNGQFHSCAEEILQFLLEALSDEEMQSVLFEVMTQVITNVVKKISYKYSDLFWKVVTAVLKQAFQSTEMLDKNTEEYVDCLLKISGLAVEYQDGKFLNNCSHFITNFLSLDIGKLTESTLQTYCKVSILLLLSVNIRMAQENASSLTKKIINAKNENVFLYFVENTSDYSGFEALILPNFLKFCYASELGGEYLYTLTKIVMKKSPCCGSGINLEAWKRYPIDFGNPKANAEIMNILLGFINVEDDKNVHSENDKMLCSLLCLPHVTSVDTESVKMKLKKLVVSLCETLSVATEVDKRNDILFLLLNVLEALVHVADATDLIECFQTVLAAVLPLVANADYFVSLKILDLHLTSLACHNFVEKEMLERINQVLSINLCSPYHEVRLLTLHVYTLFESVIAVDKSESEEFKVFSLCYSVESVEPQVQSFRAQLHSLECLTYGRSQANMCQNTPYKMFPLQYLCGCLYINFKLLWEPVLKIISTFAQGLQTTEFWEFFGAELIRSMNNTRSPPQVNFKTDRSKVSFIDAFFEKQIELKFKPDFFNYCLLLWKAMEFFPEVVEEKNRQVVELILEYMNNGDANQNSVSMLNCNIQQYNTHVDKEIMDNECVGFKGRTQKPQKAKIKMLLAQLAVLAKMKNPRALYREPELNKLYFELLSHKNSDVQKRAFYCLMTYKYKYLTPYQQNILNLIDDKNFKNELALFRVDNESSSVQKDHREGLIPVIIQIMFAKMTAKTGLRTGGRAAGQQRRNIILRFLAGCDEKEMKIFIDKAFGMYSAFLKETIVVEEISKQVDLQKFILPKRLLSSLHLLTLIFEHFGGLMNESLQRYLLNVLLVIGSHLKGAYEQSSEVHVGYLPALRMARTVCLKVLTRFFNLFDDYKWSSCELNAIFEAFIWPYLDKLSFEGIHSPTALLKLFVQWGSVPKYFPLLVKYKNLDKNEYILVHIMKLLLNSNTKPSVTNVIMEMLENMLSLKADENEEKISIENITNIDDHPLCEKINYGSSILLPHAPCILDKIKLKLEKTKNISGKELSILSRISELVWQPEISDSVLRLFLPLVCKRCRSTSEQVVQQQLTTVENLLGNVEQPLKHLKQISPLFGVVAHVSCRKLLCQILEKMSEKNVQFKATSNLISLLNAWDVKWLDQADFEKRCAAFRQIRSLVENGSVDLELGILLIYNCYYYVSKETDLALKDSASYSLKLVVPYLLHAYKGDLDYVLNETAFTIIRDGIKSKSSEMRYEAIKLLGCIARECSDAHLVLQDLNKFANKIDLEVDCFENLTHLQLYRHTRAVLKIAQILKEQKTAPSCRTLTHFILPLTTFYLCNEKYASKNSLVDAAIDVLNTVCRLLPWHQYELVLKYYLGKLRHKTEYQRQLVRIVVAILDAFHFDLSKGEFFTGIQKETSSINDVNEMKNKSENKNETDTVKESDDQAGDDDKKQMEENDLDISELTEEPALEEEEQSVDVDVDLAAVEKTSVLCKSAANRVIRTIQFVLLPQLHKALAEMTDYERSHKVNRKKTGAEREEEDLIKVPLSLAVVKLLQKLPKILLDSNLPRIFMKACTFLKSRLDSVRRVARETLQNILTSLGPEYLKILLAEMVTLLSRGYQVHVLVYTVHAVLNCLKGMYKPGDINEVLITVLHICKADLFGVTAEEKEVVKITRKVSEAKSTKTFDTFKILAQFITESCLLDLLISIKEILATCHSYKIINRANECLRHIAIGLIENEFLSVDSLLKFAFGVASESIPVLLTDKTESAVQKEKVNKRNKPDCFILPESPGRAGPKLKAKVSTTTNSHLLIEFALKLCHLILKREKIRGDDFQTFIDPFIEIFKNCLLSKHVKLNTIALQCLCWTLKYDLPSLKNNVKHITEAIFAILHKYAAAGLSKGDNFDLVLAAFKAVTVLVRDARYYNVDTDKLKALLLYAEQDLHDPDRQATAFGLLRAIISRKLILPELYESMQKLSELSIVSEVDHVRLQSRLVCLQFILEYPLGKKLDGFVSFYLSQMNFELQFGRESALEMVQSFITSFPENVLKDYSGTFLIALGARLVNDDVPECRRRAADCLKSMFTRLPQQDLDELFEMIILWLKDRKINHRQMAAHLCGLLILVEKANFESRLSTLIPVVYQQFGLNKPNKPGRFVLLPKESEVVESSEKERLKDHHYFQVLQMLLKLCAQCPQFLKRKGEVGTLAVHIQTLLAYPHEWVRLAASQFLGFVVASISIDHLADLIISNNSDDEGYLCSDPRKGIESLTLDLCSQLQPGGIREEFAQQVIKILIFVARVLQRVPLNSSDAELKLNILWLTKRMRKIINNEIVVTPSNTTLRTVVFKWIAGVCTVLDTDKIKSVLHHLLAPLVREMLTKEETNSPLKNLAKEVCNIIKKRIDVDTYSSVLLKVQQRLSVRRAERKRARSQLAITDPEIHAKKKIKRHEKKKIVKKRKREEIKGKKKTFKKRKTVDLDNDEIL